MPLCSTIADISMQYRGKHSFVSGCESHYSRHPKLPGHRSAALQARPPGRLPQPRPRGKGGGATLALASAAAGCLVAVGGTGSCGNSGESSDACFLLRRGRRRGSAAVPGARAGSDLLQVDSSGGSSCGCLLLQCRPHRRHPGGRLRRCNARRWRVLRRLFSLFFLALYAVY